jgi:hypothetical protein
MRFQQQPFERFELTHLDMNVFTIDWNFFQAIFAFTSTWIFNFIEYKKHHCFQSAILTFLSIGH